MPCKTEGGDSRPALIVPGQRMRPLGRDQKYQGNFATDCDAEPPHTACTNSTFSWAEYRLTPGRNTFGVFSARKASFNRRLLAA